MQSASPTAMAPMMRPMCDDEPVVEEEEPEEV